MKRFMVFGFNQFYPIGGMSDFLFDADSEEEIRKKMPEIRREKCLDYYQIFDSETRTTFEI